MLKLGILVIFYFTFPLVIIYLCRKWSFFQKLGTIVLAYAFGLIIGTAGILPEGSNGYKLALQTEPKLEKAVLNNLISEGKALPEDVDVNNIKGLQDGITTFTILLAFPLLLFSLNLRRW